ncbi:MAG: hypothetical protein ACM3XM_04705, partial [Mycobacterium leprae]
MCARTQGIGPTPPLTLAWRGLHSFVSAVVGDNGLYGITAEGRLAACAKENGSPRWITDAVYRPSRLTLDGNTLYAFRSGTGLMAIQDQGSTFSEHLQYGIPTPEPAVSQTVVLGTKVHLIVDGVLVATDEGGALLFKATLNTEGPHSLYPLGSDLLVVS